MPKKAKEYESAFLLRSQKNDAELVFHSPCILDLKFQGTESYMIYQQHRVRK